VPRTTGRGTGLLAGFAIGVAACTSELVTSVGVTSVTVEPASMNAVEGERHPLDAVVVDDRGEIVPDAPVVWTSSDETVAGVDRDGVVEARGPGEVEIRATFRDAWGAATVRVLPQRAIGVSRDSVAMTAGSIGIDPPPEVVHVANTGVGALEGLTARVRYSDGAERAWLAAELGSSQAPTTLTLTADAAPLGIGVYRATVVLEAEGLDVEPVEIAVTLRVGIL
jgi:hypothetical protein